MKILSVKQCCLGLSVMIFSAFAQAESIHLISREEGSGTRGAFVEIFSIQKEIRGKKVDNLSLKAEITNSTAVMLTSVAKDENAIGYVSLGSLSNTVKALKIEGVEASVENVKSKIYPIARPFNVVMKKENPLTVDFLNFVISTEAEPIVVKAGYIALSQNAFTTQTPEGKLVIAGSSSITPLMEKLKEAYLLKNPKAKIEIQQSDSTTGVNATLQDIADLGMVSREVRPSELEKGLKVKVIAMDGLALIVHPKNKTDSLSKKEVKAIFEGSLKDWGEIQP